VLVPQAVASAAHPFIGLRPFDTADQPFFFGRDDSIDAVDSLVANNSFVAVIGSSGGGKSSLVRAGLLPKLKRRTEGTWLLAQPMTPGDDPIGNLARAISSLRPEDELSETWEENVEACLRRSKFGVVEALSLFPELAQGGDVVIVVDQFEELFRFADLRAEPRSKWTTPLQNRDEATTFVRLLLAADSSFIRVHIVLAMRSDYFGDCSLFYGLPKAVARHLFLVPGLTRDQRAAAITRPITEKAGGAVDPELVQRLLNDTNNEFDQLPIIQHTMMRCWHSAFKRADGGPVHVVVDDYKTIGEFKNALSNHANEIFQEFERFDDENKPAVSRRLVAKRIFQALTEEDQDGRVIRRPMRFDDLEEYVASSDWTQADVGEAVHDVVSRLAATDCSFLRIEDDSVVDIGHEALIRRWSKLNGDGQENWVREEQEDGDAYLYLAKAARGGGIISGAELKYYEDWWADRKPTAAWAKQHVKGEKDYLEEVTKTLVRSRESLDDSERLKFLAIGVSAALVVLAIVGVSLFAWKTYIDNKQIIAANTQTIVAKQETIAANQNTIAESILEQVEFAGREAIPLRERLVMLVDASSDSEKHKDALGDKKDKANEALQALLLRAPVLGAPFPAALNFDGTRLGYLSASTGKGKVLTVDLPKTLPKTSSNPPTTPVDLNLLALHPSFITHDVTLGEVSGAAFGGVPLAAPTIGFVRNRANDATQKAAKPDDGDEEDLIVSPGRLSVLSGIMRPKANPGPSCDDSWQDGRFEPTWSLNEPVQDNVLVVSPRDLGTKDVPPLADPETKEISLEKFGRGLYPPEVEFGNNSVRVISMSIGNGGVPITLCVLPIQESQAAFEDKYLFPRKIGWDPIGLKARRYPVFAVDCDEFAVLATKSASPDNKKGGQADANQGEVVHPILYAGDFLGGAKRYGGEVLGTVKSKELDIELPSESVAQQSSVAISRGCSYAIVRVSPAPNSLDKSGKVLLIKFDQFRQFGDVSQYEVPPLLKSVMLPPGYYWPALAGTPLAASKAVRVAWLLDNGLSVVDLQDGQKQVAPVLLPDNGQKQVAPPLSPDTSLFLPGFTSFPSVTRLTMSRDGSFLLVLSQRDLSATPEFRLFDLRIDDRRALLQTLDGPELRKVACRVARFLQNSSSAEEITALPQGAEGDGKLCK